MRTTPSSRRATAVAVVTALSVLVAGLGTESAAADRLPPGAGATLPRPPLQPVYMPSAEDARMASALTSRASTATFGTAFTGAVIDAGTGRVIWQRNGSTGYMPASTTKLFTAFDALTTIGPDRRFTTLVRQGPSADQAILVGSGDPGMSSSQLDTMARTTATSMLARSVKTSRVYVDDDVYPSFTPAYGWIPSYVPGDFTPLRGLVRDQRNLADTSADAGAYYAARLTAYGVKATYLGRINSATTAPVLASSTGPTVSATLSRMLLYSNNDIAESMHRLVAIVTRTGNSWTAARTAESLILDANGLSIGTLYDGSGLSRADRLSAIQLATVVARGVDPANTALWPMRSAAAIPTAGRTGTLSSAYGRFDTAPSSCAAGRLWAKTGTLADSVALAGWTKGADGRVKTFAFVVNGKTSSLALKRSVDALAATVTGCY